jgi:hypothetical protein
MALILLEFRMAELSALAPILPVDDLIVSRFSSLSGLP